MDCLALVMEARAAGSTVVTDAGRLIVRGPKRAAELAQRLIANKPAVLAALDELSAERLGVWWDDRVPADSSPILHLPPRECIGPKVCSRIGFCERHAADNPCRVAS